ncbi:UPF0764 protein C16orf89 homolog [Eurytemora carolleeae]|uniref:UPF0764 protein C16orf89 homolog n=1 Tax=Eurytemora carolleeae TaxID=1294199 RepID=UPI000C764800|nr:UPF0764 protein C16orf89 homolog [Eurytemora carolleeae]|eukprot:XP_023343257.1 UPF0764 protein C16orf89 homolog [Eurytemora affinis]
MYTLTHKLLYHVLRMKRGCKEDIGAIEYFCQRSWNDIHRTWGYLQTTEENRFCSTDLFLEQMLFCSMLGYEQFFKTRKQD